MYKSSLYITVAQHSAWYTGISLESKESACGAGDLAQEDLLEKEWQPTPILLPGKSHGWRNVVSYSPWGHKGLDTTEQLHFTYICLYTCDFGPNTTNERSKRC